MTTPPRADTLAAVYGALLERRQARLARMQPGDGRPVAGRYVEPQLADDGWPVADPPAAQAYG
jgi:hypothetical protein